MSHKLLKEQTKSLHYELDQTSVMRRVMAADVKLTDYQLFLLLHHSVYSVIQQDLAALYATLGWEYSDRVTLLESDIAHLCENRGLKGMTLGIENSLTLSIPQCLGTVYVLEGARHGNRFILEHLQRSLQISVAESSFLYHDSGINWTELIRKVDALGPNDMTMNINAAKFTFSLYVQHVKKLNFINDERYTI
jgi:heme oxygenase